MEDLAADFIIENNEPLELEAEITEPEHFDCVFELYAAGTTWGSISGTLRNQTDLQAALDLKADKTEVESVTGALSDSIIAVSDNLQTEATTRAENDTILQNNINAVSDNLTAEIGNRTSADTILQGNINTLDDKVDSLTGALDDRIDTLSDTVTANYNTLDDKIDSVNGALSDSITAVDDKYNSITGGLSDDIDALESVVSANYNTLSDSISDETTARQNADSIIGDSITALDNKFDSITGGLSDSITAIDSTIGGYGDIVTYNAADFATSIQGALADTALQPNDNISELNNDANYIINSASGRSVNIYGLRNSGLGAINVGEGSAAEGDYTTAIGYSARSTATRAIQIGRGTNSTAGTLSVGFDNGGNYILLSGITGLIPDDRLSSNIARTANIPTVNNATITIQKNGTTVESFTLNQTTNETVNISVPTTAAEVNALPDTTTINDLTTSTQQAALNSGANTTNIGQIATNTNAISTEVTDRQNADIALQNQIDAIVSSSDVFDIVGTYAELQAYDISTVPVNDIIKVLVDSTHNNAATYYRCVENGGVKSWSYIGSEGAYYTKGEADAAFVPQTRTVNGKALNNNITLNASDVGALPDSTVIPTVNNSTITIQKNGAAVDTFTLNQATAKTINITVPTDTNDLTNGAGFISGISYADVITALGFTPYNSTNPNGYITSADLSGYATESWVNNQGFITGITSSDIITALSYTPYDASNPDGFITSADLANYLQKDVAQSSTGTLTLIGQKKLEFKQSAAADKLGFTCFNASGTEIGAFEYRPNTIGSGALFNINVPYTSTSYVGFRYWGTAVNIVAPKVATAGTYYIPTHITDGNTTVTATNAGVLDISSLLPTVPTNISAFTNDSGYITSSALTGYATENFVTSQGYITGITSSDVITALGFTPYNSTNPNGYITSAALNGYATESWVGNQGYALVSSLATVATSGSYTDLTNTPTIPAAQIQSDWDQTDTTAVDYIKNKPYIPSGVVVDQVYDATSTNAQSGIAIAGAGFLTSSALSGYATETWVNNQGFITGITSSDVTTALGYTPYNSTNPNGYITSSALSGYATESFVTSQGYITGITSSDIITALSYTPYDASNPDGYITSSALTPYALISSLATVATSGDYDDLINKPTIPTALSDLTVSAGSNITISGDTISATDTTYSDFTGADSVTAGTSGLVPAPSAGDEDKILSGGGTWNALKTVNNTSILGSGNIDTSEIFVAEYGNTSYADVLTAYNANKLVYATDSNGNQYQLQLNDNNANAFIFSKIIYDDNTQNNIITYLILRSDGWRTSSFSLADATDLDAKVNKSGDTMTGGLLLDGAIYSKNGTFPTTTPSSNTYLVGYELYGNNTRLGLMGLGYYASGNTALYLQHERTVSGTIKYSSLQVGIDDSGNGYCTFPNSNCVDAQWVQKYSKLADTSGTKAGTSYSLRSYLPNDGQKYEVKFRLFAYTSSSTCSYYCNTDIFNNGQTSTAVESDYCFVYGGGYSRQNTVVFDLPVGTGRYVKLYGSGSSSVILCALGYRRIGTNS